MSIRLGASAIVFDKRGKVLIEKRDDLRTWVFPGGGVEDSESPEESAIRETLEETGIKIKIKRLAVITLTDTKLIKRINLVYLAERTGGKLRAQPGETRVVRFVKESELKRLISPWYLRKFQAAVSQDSKIKVLRRRSLGIPLSKLPVFIWRRWLKKKFY